MHKTGIGRYARNIFSAVVAEAPHHEYVVAVQDERDAAWVRATAPAVRRVIAPAAQYSPRELLRAPSLGSSIDVWHSPHPYHWGLGARHRTVLTVLDLIQLTHAIGLKNRVAREPLRAIMWTACRRADRLVAISATTRDDFHHRMGVPREKFHVTPLAPDPRFAAPVDPADVDAARERWGLGRRVILYVGMTQPHKNLDGLLRALAIMPRRASAETQLAIVGPVVATERRTLQARMQELGVADRVRFLDWLSDDEVRLAYHAASVLALPSLAEGFGLTLLEAMRCSTPCVASDLPVLHEVAGDAARFVDPTSVDSIAAGLTEVLDDERLAAELSARGLVNVARFSWRAAALETLAAYEAAVAR